MACPGVLLGDRSHCTTEAEQVVHEPRVPVPFARHHSYLGCRAHAPRPGLRKWGNASGIVQAGLSKWDCASGTAQAGLCKWDCASGIAQAGLR